MELRFSVTQNGPHCEAVLAVDGSAGKAEITRLVSGEAFEVALDEFENGAPARKNLQIIGERLWSFIAPKPIAEVFAQRRNAAPRDLGAITIRLAVPDLFRGYPWESIYAGVEGFLARQNQIAIVHEPCVPGNFPQPPPTPPQRPIRVLVLIPERSKLRVDLERAEIAAAFSDPMVGEVDFLDSRVTQRALQEKMRCGPWDVVHYVGHGGFNADSDLEIFLNDDNGALRMLHAQDFAQDLSNGGVNLAVMNCCHGGGAVGANSLQAFHPTLIANGIPAVISMRYAIADDTARRFSREFYENLLGPARGRIDAALAGARGALYASGSADAFRAFVTPVLHCVRGYEACLPQPPSEQRRNIPDIPLPNPLIGPRQPGFEQLGASLKNGECVVVLGAAFREKSGTRHGAVIAPPPLPGLRDFAEQLASDADHPYPLSRRHFDETLCGNAAGWLDCSYMQWVAQFSESASDDRAAILAAATALYSQLEIPPRLAALARWKMPALFYLGLDGILERIVRRQESWLQHVLEGPDAEPPVDGADPRCLVLVRRSYSSAEAVITEEDHELLSARIARTAPRLASAALAPRRTLFIAGANPRDAVLRQLCARLREGTSKRAHGATFFHCETADEVDHAYWKRYKVVWLRGELGALLDQLQAKISAP